MFITSKILEKLPFESEALGDEDEPSVPKQSLHKFNHITLQ